MIENDLCATKEVENVKPAQNYGVNVLNLAGEENFKLVTEIY